MCSFGAVSSIRANWYTSSGGVSLLLKAGCGIPNVAGLSSLLSVISAYRLICIIGDHTNVHFEVQKCSRWSN